MTEEYEWGAGERISLGIPSPIQTEDWTARIMLITPSYICLARASGSNFVAKEGVKPRLFLLREMFLICFIILIGNR